MDKKEKKFDKNSILNIVFIVMFMAILIVPVIFMNREKNQVSDIDNSMLTEWEGLDWKLEKKDIVENYVDDRIGFREPAINAFIEFNDKFLDVMVHPLFMYGKDGHIFYKDPYYVSAYQRLNTNPEFLDSFVVFLQDTKSYLDSKDIDFLYYLCPDKKTIYPEYFPDTVHVNTDNESVIEYMTESLDKTDIDYIIPVNELLSAKENEVVYNKLYDATHWNERGAFIGHKLIDEKIQELYDDVPELKEDDFIVDTVIEDTLDVARFPINDVVPRYTLKNDTSSDMTTYLLDYIDGTTTTFYSHYVNPECGNNRILLVFTDSYFGNYHKFYQNRFKEVYFVHRQNYDYLQYYVNLFFPDMVIFETAERSITGEMEPQLEIIGKPYYEKPYDGIFDYSGSDGLSCTITSVAGVRAENNTLWLNVNGGDSILSIRGYLDNCKAGHEYSVYAQIGGDAIVECDCDALHRISEEEGLNEFSVNVQRRYLMEEDIDLIVIDNTTGEHYLLNKYEVRYEQ